MAYTFFVCFFLTSWATLQASSEEGCCGAYHTELLENMTSTLRSSRNDRTVQYQGNNKAMRLLGEDIGKNFKELGSKLGRKLESLRNGLGDDLNETKLELMENREEIKRLRQDIGQELKALRIELGQDFKENQQEINKLSLNLGQELKAISKELKGLGAEIKRGNQEFREEREVQHKEMMMVFKRILENNVTEEEDLSISTDCASLYKSGNKTSGVYKVKPAGVRASFDVYCEMEKNDGGWTVIQRRGDFGTPGDYFYKTWNEYKIGFGDLEEEHWLGNDKISALTMQEPYELDIDLVDYDNKSIYANYKKFTVQGEEQLYAMDAWDFSGNDYNLLGIHTGMKFSTHDRDNDRSRGNCAVKHAGAWWYNDCYVSNLNSKKERFRGYLQVYTSGREYVDIYSVLMKIRPMSF